MSNIDRNFKPGTHLPGTERYTTPEEIAALGKFLRKQIKDLNDKTEPSSETTPLPFDNSGVKIPELTELNYSPEKLLEDQNNSSQTIEELLESESPLTITNPLNPTLSDEVLSITGNNYNKLSDTIENITENDYNKLSDLVESIDENDYNKLSKSVERIKENKYKKLSNNVDKIKENKYNKLSHTVDNIEENGYAELSDVVEDIDENNYNKLSDTIENITENDYNKLSDLVEDIEENDYNELSNYVDTVEENNYAGLSDLVDEIEENNYNQLSDTIITGEENKYDQLSNLVEKIEDTNQNELSTVLDKIEENDYKKLSEIVDHLEDNSDAELSKKVLEIEDRDQVKLSNQVETIDGYEDLELSDELVKLEDSNGINLSNHREELQNDGDPEIISTLGDITESKLENTREITSLSDQKETITENQLGELSEVKLSIEENLYESLSETREEIYENPYESLSEIREEIEENDFDQLSNITEEIGENKYDHLSNTVEELAENTYDHLSDIKEKISENPYLQLSDIKPEIEEDKPVSLSDFFDPLSPRNLGNQEIQEDSYYARLIELKNVVELSEGNFKGLGKIATLLDQIQELTVSNGNYEKLGGLEKLWTYLTSIISKSGGDVVSARDIDAFNNVLLQCDFQNSLLENENKIREYRNKHRVEKVLTDGMKNELRKDEIIAKERYIRHPRETSETVRKKRTNELIINSAFERNENSKEIVGIDQVREDISARKEIATQHRKTYSNAHQIGKQLTNSIKEEHDSKAEELISSAISPETLDIVSNPPEKTAEISDSLFSKWFNFNRSEDDPGVIPMTKLPGVYYGGNAKDYLLHNYSPNEFLRFTVEQTIGRTPLKGKLKQTLIDDTLNLLIIGRNKLEDLAGVSRTRLPGVPNNGRESVGKSLLKSAATGISLKGAVTEGLKLLSGNSGPRNRPTKHPEDLVWFESTEVPYDLSLKNRKFGQSYQRNFGLDYLDESFRVLGPTGTGRHAIGIGQTLRDLVGMTEFTSSSTLTELKQAFNRSPRITTPSKFTSTYISENYTTLDSNHVWEIQIKPYVGALNGYCTWLPSIAEIDSDNKAAFNYTTKYARGWLPITGYELQSSKVTSKEIPLYEGNFSVPVGLELVNELRLTFSDDCLKSLRRYFELCAKTSVNMSNLHSIDPLHPENSIYREGFDPTLLTDKDFTAILENTLAVGSYKNTCFLVSIYVLSPQYATIKTLELLCVMKDFTFENQGESDSAPTELQITFSIVGENPYVGSSYRGESNEIPEYEQDRVTDASSGGFSKKSILKNINVSAFL